jgi:hypothetical protein
MPFFDPSKKEDSETYEEDPQQWYKDLGNNYCI